MKAPVQRLPRAADILHWVQMAVPERVSDCMPRIDIVRVSVVPTLVIASVSGSGVGAVVDGPYNVILAIAGSLSLVLMTDVVEVADDLTPTIAMKVSRFVPVGMSSTSRLTASARACAMLAVMVREPSFIIAKASPTSARP